MKTIPVDKIIAYRKRLQGKTYRQIGEELGVSKQAIQYKLVGMDIWYNEYRKQMREAARGDLVREVLEMIVDFQDQNPKLEVTFRMRLR